MRRSISDPDGPAAGWASDAPRRHWTARLYDATNLVVLLAQLNLLLIVFTLLGGVVLGLAPALVAAATCIRSARRNELHRPFQTFARTWSAQFFSANAALLPLVLAIGLLGWGYISFSLSGEGASVQRIVSLVAFAVATVMLVWATAMMAHYDLPRGRVIPLALRFSLLNLIPSVLQLFLIVALVYATGWFYALPLLIGLGAWAYASVTFSLLCFARNDQLVATATETTPDSLHRTR